jgi:hypothetical protein
MHDLLPSLLYYWRALTADPASLMYADVMRTWNSSGIAEVT